MYSLATLHDDCIAVIYVLILARPHTPKAVLLHYVTPVLALHRLHASPVSFSMTRTGP